MKIWQVIEKYKLMNINQGSHGQGKVSENGFFFKVREKSGNFITGSGKFGIRSQVREKSGNFGARGPRFSFQFVKITHKKTRERKVYLVQWILIRRGV